MWTPEDIKRERDTASKLTLDQRMVAHAANFKLRAGLLISFLVLGPLSIAILVVFGETFALVPPLVWIGSMLGLVFFGSFGLLWWMSRHDTSQE
jgi:hypothetical protein